MNKQIEMITNLVKAYNPETVAEVEDYLLNSPSSHLMNDLMSEYIFTTCDGERVDDEFGCHPIFNDILNEVCYNLNISE